MCWQYFNFCTEQELQNIVNTCELELMSFDIAINARKSCTMCIGPQRDVKCGNITINTQNLPRVDNVHWTMPNVHFITLWTLYLEEWEEQLLIWLSASIVRRCKGNCSCHGDWSHTPHRVFAANDWSLWSPCRHALVPVRCCDGVMLTPRQSQLAVIQWLSRLVDVYDLRGTLIFCSMLQKSCWFAHHPTWRRARSTWAVETRLDTSDNVGSDDVTHRPGDVGLVK